MEQNYTEEEIDLREIFQILQYKWKLILTVTIISGIIVLLGSIAYNFIKAPIPYYQATADINVVTTADKTTQKQAFIEMARSQTVIETTITKQKLTQSLEDLSSNLTVSSQDGSNIIKLTVLNEDADLARQIVGALRQEAIAFATNASDFQSVATRGEVSLADDPVLSKSPVNILLNTVIGIVLGLMGIIFFIFLQYFLNDKIQTSDDLEKYLGINVLAIIPSTMENKETSEIRSNK